MKALKYEIRDGHVFVNGEKMFQNELFAKSDGGILLSRGLRFMGRIRHLDKGTREMVLNNLRESHSKGEDITEEEKIAILTEIGYKYFSTKRFKEFDGELFEDGKPRRLCMWMAKLRRVPETDENGNEIEPVVMAAGSYGENPREQEIECTNAAYDFFLSTGMMGDFDVGYYEHASIK